MDRKKTTLDYVSVTVMGWFITAGAGNTVWRIVREFDSRGSSLRAQGTLSSALIIRRKARFIPAGAGNTGNQVASNHCGSSLRAQGTLYRRLVAKNA